MERKIVQGNPVPILNMYYDESIDRAVAISNGLVDANNSTNEILNIGQEFTGESTNISGYSSIKVNVYSDVASATDGLLIEQSVDGINWDFDDEFTIPANRGKQFTIPCFANYLRVRYINGANAQTAFRLQTILKSMGAPTSAHRIEDSIIDDDDAVLVKSVLTAKIADDGFINIQATPSNNLRVTDAESGLAIAKGEVVGTSFIHKFGNAPDFDQPDGKITVWDGADDGTAWENMIYDYSTTAAIDSISSNNAGNTQTLQILGLDTNWEMISQTKALNGQNRVALDTPLRRVFRMINIGTVNLAGHVFCFENVALAAGVPSDPSKIRAIIDDGNNQTLMAVFTIPAGYTGYMRDWYASLAGGSKDSAYEIDLIARPFGQVFQLKHRASIVDTGTSYIQHKYQEPGVYTEKTDIEMRCAALAVGVVGASLSAGFDIVLVEN